MAFHRRSVTGGGKYGFQGQDRIGDQNSMRGAEKHFSFRAGRLWYACRKDRTLTAGARSSSRVETIARAARLGAILYWSRGAVVSIHVTL